MHITTMNVHSHFNSYCAQKHKAAPLICHLRKSEGSESQRKPDPPAYRLAALCKLQALQCTKTRANGAVKVQPVVKYSLTSLRLSMCSHHESFDAKSRKRMTAGTRVNDTQTRNKQVCFMHLHVIILCLF